MNYKLLFPLVVLFSLSLGGSGLSDLTSRGYSVIPEPQKITLSGGDFEFSNQWHLAPASLVRLNLPGVQSLTELLADRFHLALRGGSSGAELRLDIRPGAVQQGASQDSDQEAIAAQAYRLVLSPKKIEITANAEAGLFYGVQTLLQLVKSTGGKLYLPAGEFVDWPDLRLRAIYWDDAHHLERLPELKRAVRLASFFKINGFALKLEGHFVYRSAPAITEPQALSSAELQELTDYGIRYHVEVIPYLDAPAHVAFILKHPEYAHLREFPDSNYELCATNPETLKLLYGMYDDLLAANRGVHYFYLSTDESYYLGMAHLSSCDEATRQRELGSPGKIMAEFLQKAAGHLHDAGRQVIFWGEYPIKPGDIASLPPYLINGETYGPKFDPLYKSRGIRQMIYQPIEGEERFFPQYSLLPPERHTMPLHEDIERISDGISKVAAEPARKTSDLIGITVAGWGDMGLHPETFWLGYATVTASGWHNWTSDAKAARTSFYPLFYGPQVTRMDRVYELMSYQAQVWTDSWDMIDSKLRKPIWGNSEKVFQPGKLAKDQSLPLPPVPNNNLAYTGRWSEANEARLRSARQALAENDELQALLAKNLLLATTNVYNLEVLQSIARLCRQNLGLLVGMQLIDQNLRQASLAAAKQESQRALQSVDQALDQVQEIRTVRNGAFQNATRTWYKSWLPRVEQANGRKFVHELDDVKDHLPDRTIDMSYLIYRDLNLPFNDWYNKTLRARNEYAASHQQPVKTTRLDWLQY